MVYYFSGTGNSQWIAERLAALTGDQAASIADLTRDGPNAVAVSAGSVIGVVFPVYAWGAPKLVERFCKGVRVSEGAYAYAVCTCGDEAGNAVKKFRRVFPYTSAWSVAMPNNYIIGFDVDPPELAHKKIENAGARLMEIAEAVRGQKRIYSVHAGRAAWLKTAVVSPAFNAFARGTKPFYAGDECISCSLCANECPSGAITMTDGKPVWTRKHCAQCMRCMMHCPEDCIQYGAFTKKKGRYFFREGL